MNNDVDSATNPTPPAEQSNGQRRRALLGITAAIIVLAVAAVLYWNLVLTKRERTDDAYVSGNQVAVSSQLNGTVIAVLADDMQLVQAGQELVRLDPVDAATELNRAGSNLAVSVRQFRQLTQQATQYDSLIVNRRLELARAQDDLQRREPLLAEQAIAGEELRHARDAVQLAQAALTQAESQARAAHAMIDGTTAGTNPSVLLAKGQYLVAWLAAQRNAIVAPVTGHVAQRSVQAGQRIQPGQSLLTIIPLNNLWIDANFKEVQLRNLRLGQVAEVDSDLYGDNAVFHGKVSGIGIGTGAAFSLLPAQNASGNWIKVIQRVPVRIQLDPQELATHPLRIGLSTTVTVDTHDRSGALLATVPNANPVVETTVYTPDLAKADAQAEAIIAKQL